MRRLIILLTLVVSTVCWPVPVAGSLNIALNPQWIGTTSGNSSNVSPPAPETIALSQIVNTTLAGLTVLFTSVTYWISTRRTHGLSNEIWLPSKFVQLNLATILAKTWPQRFKGTPEQTPSETSEPWVLFFPSFITKLHKVTSTGGVRTSSKIYHVEGYDEVQEQSYSPSSIPSNIPIRVRTGSPIMKTLVQIAIWNYFSLWLVLVMIFNTLVYNGFLNNKTTNDSAIRLFLVGIYTLANLAFQWRSSVLLYRNFTLVLFQACWSLICGTFVLVDSDWHSQYTTEQPTGPVQNNRYLDRLAAGAEDQKWFALKLELFGKAEQSATYHLLSNDDNVFDSEGTAWQPGDNIKESHLHMSVVETEREFVTFTKTLREAEIKACEKCTESALEKILANIAVLSGICLVTGLAPWASTNRNDATTAQLGSYALLLSVSTGLLALIGINSQLANATESTKRLLLLQEKTIQAAAENDDERFIRRFSFTEIPEISFIKDSDKRYYLTSFRLWRLANPLDWLACVLLGPAMLLFPGQADKTSKIYFKVHGKNFGLWIDLGSPTKRRLFHYT